MLVVDRENVVEQVAVILSTAKHSAKAITNCKVTEVFYPVREDYKNN